MKTAVVALVALGVAGSAYAQNAPGTSYQGAQNPALPPSTTGTAKPNALDANPSGAEAAARYKFEQAGFTNVKGLSRSVDGVWSGRG